MQLKTWRYIALMLSALTMAMSFAHAMEMPARMSWDAALWAGTTVDGALYMMFGTLGGGIVVLNLIALVVVAILMRRHADPARRLSVIAAGLYILSFILFWIVIAPVNSEIATWAGGNIPEDWSRWRLRWETGHLVNAVLQLIGFAALCWSVLEETPPQA